MESSGTRSGATERDNTKAQEPDSFIASPRARRTPSRGEAAAPRSCQDQPRLGLSQRLPGSAKYLSCLGQNRAEQKEVTMAK